MKIQGVPLLPKANFILGGRKAGAFFELGRKIGGTTVPQVLCDLSNA